MSVCSNRAWVTAAAALVSALTVGVRPSGAQTGQNVLLVVNQNSDASETIGVHYASVRQLPDEHVVRLDAPTDDAIDWQAYSQRIEQPIAAWINRHGLHDRVLYIVLTKGIPLRIAGTQGTRGTTGSVDSELTLLYQKMLGSQVLPAGRMDNPYFAGARGVETARPFSRLDSDLFLVTRLDGYTVDDVISLIDRGVQPSTEGRVVLDQKSTLIDRGGDQWLQEAADRLEVAAGAERVWLETTREVASVLGPVIGYYSWGSNDPANRLRRTGLQFVPGAIAGTFVSTDGRTFNEPPPDWTPASSRVLGYGSQSLAADLIREGITGVAAHVSEPLLDATIRPQILFPAYFSGFNLGESYYLAMPFLSWQTVIVGDPLVRPFPREPLTQEQIHQGMDEASERPTLFTERWLARRAASGLNPEALKVILRIDARAARDDRTEEESLLQEAIRLEPKMTAAHLRLATIYEGRSAWDDAVEHYRAVVAAEPNHVAALNNLAYILAERLGQPAEALPLAERAHRAAPGPVIADTLAWVHHLLGDDETAGPLIERAVSGGAANADIQLHAAFIREGLGRLSGARSALEAALKLNPSLGAREDVQALRKRIGG